MLLNISEHNLLLLFPFWRLRVELRSRPRLGPNLVKNWGMFCVRDGICVDPPLCRGTSQVKYRSRIIDLVRAGETVGKLGEVDEKGERELLLVVRGRCGKE